MCHRSGAARRARRREPTCQSCHSSPGCFCCFIIVLSGIAEDCWHSQGCSPSTAKFGTLTKPTGGPGLCGVVVGLSAAHWRATSPDASRRLSSLSIAIKQSTSLVDLENQKGCQGLRQYGLVVLRAPSFQPLDVVPPRWLSMISVLKGWISSPFFGSFCRVCPALHGDGQHSATRCSYRP